MRVIWTEAYTTLQEMTQMSCENRQVAWAKWKADELAKTEAIKDGAEVAERIAKDALNTRKKVSAAIRYAATFQDEVEELVDVERKSARNTKTSLSGFLAVRNLKVPSTEWSERYWTCGNVDLCPKTTSCGFNEEKGI